MGFNPEVYEVHIDEYKGKPILRIPVGGGFALGLGVKKAQSVLEHIEEIQAFAESNGKTFQVDNK